MKGELTFDPVPHCCGKALGNDHPGIKCPVCGTVYNADDIMEIMLNISYSGKKPVGRMNDHVRTQKS